MLALAACGSDRGEVSTAEPGDEPIPVDADGGIGDGAEPLPVDDSVDLPVDGEQPIAFGDVTIIPNTPAPVSESIAAPSAVTPNPDNDQELWVDFIGGDPNCTAARVDVLVETPDKIGVELAVGLTKDALSRSCMAGEFPLRVVVPMNEPVGDKQISWSQPATDDAPQMVTPDLTTDDFVGLTEADALAIVEPQLIEYRITRVDDEFFAGTDDYNPGRLNFEIDDGIITSATLG